MWGRKTRVAKTFGNKFSIDLESIRQRIKKNPLVVYTFSGKQRKNYFTQEIPGVEYFANQPIKVMRGVKGSILPIIHHNATNYNVVEILHEYGEITAKHDQPIGLFQHLDGYNGISSFISFTSDTKIAANFTGNMTLPSIVEGSIIYANIMPIFIDAHRYGKYDTADRIVEADLYNQEPGSFIKPKSCNCEINGIVPHPCNDESEIGVYGSVQSREIEKVLPVINIKMPFVDNLAFAYPKGTFVNPEYQQTRSYAIGIASLFPSEIKQIQARMWKLNTLPLNERLITHNEAHIIAAALQQKFKQHQGYVFRFYTVPVECNTIDDVLNFVIEQQYQNYAEYRLDTGQKNTCTTTDKTYYQLPKKTISSQDDLVFVKEEETFSFVAHVKSDENGNLSESVHLTQSKSTLFSNAQQKKQNQQQDQEENQKALTNTKK
ncbi:MAG: hypothetical protein ACD_46C00085G0003 [uncultured bacterium]|nr:MAG: hypothetical protein ACD_46C00085G0003 [uncultured bacterium]